MREARPVPAQDERVPARRTPAQPLGRKGQRESVDRMEREVRVARMDLPLRSRGPRLRPIDPPWVSRVRTAPARLALADRRERESVLERGHRSELELEDPPARPE